MTHHFPRGPYYQPDKIFAGHCECGKSFQGATQLEAETSWLAHYRSTLTGDPSVEMPSAESS